MNECLAQRSDMLFAIQIKRQIIMNIEIVRL